MDRWRFAGDLGKSLITRRNVTPELFERIPATAYLTTTGIILSMCIAIPIGTLAALKRKTDVENFVQILALAGMFIPEFWFAIMAVLLFLLHLGWLPSSGYTSVLWRTRNKPDLFDLACDRDRFPGKPPIQRG